MSLQESPAGTGFQLPPVMLQVWSTFKALWETQAKKNNPETLRSRRLSGENYFPSSGASGARGQENLCLLWDAGGKPPSCPSRIPSNPTPHLSTPTHLCPPCFLSHLQPLESRGSLEVLDNRHHMGIRIGLGKHWNTTPSAWILGPHLLPQEDPCGLVHPWHLKVLLHQEGPEHPALRVVLEGKW